MALPGVLRRWTMCLMALWLACHVHAQTFPDRPIRIVNPFSAGGGGDLSVRAIADKLSKRLGVPVVIDTRPGASGLIGAQMVASAPPDGYTLLMGYDGSVAIASQLLKTTVNPLKDLTPITKLADSPMVFLAHPSLKVQSLKEVIDLARRDNKELAYGSAGAGTTHHMVGELLASKAGVKLLHVPYKGGSAAVMDAVAGQVPLVVTVPPTALPFVQDGRLKALAVTGKDRMSLMPDVPTVKEQGFPDFEVVSWYSLLAPARTPKPIVELLQAAVAEVLNDAEVREAYTKVGFIPVGNRPEVFSAQLQADYQRWGALIKSARIAIE